MTILRTEKLREALIRVQTHSRIDSLGHSAGDECLRRIAAALGDGLTRDHDVVARYGGDPHSLITAADEALYRA